MNLLWNSVGGDNSDCASAPSGKAYVLRFFVSWLGRTHTSPVMKECSRAAISPRRWPIKIKSFTIVNALFDGKSPFDADERSEELDAKGLRTKVLEGAVNSDDLPF